MELSNKTIGVLVADNYQELEFWYPLLRMQEAGAKTQVIGAHANKTYHSKLGYSATSQLAADAAKPDDFDALIIPGGYAPDAMRANQSMVNLVQAIFQQSKPVAAICHAAWVLISAKVLQGKRATCYHTIKDDVINAGATYVDQAVVEDGNLITSRAPSDLPLFCRAILEKLG